MFIQAENRIYHDMGAEGLDLGTLGLFSLDPVMPLLARMPNLRSLSLSRNELSQLPADLSALTHLQHLDLSGNPILALKDVLSGLRSLPALRQLEIDLSGPGENELRIHLPGLQCLNGLALAKSLGKEGRKGEEERDGFFARSTCGKSAEGPCWAVYDTHEAEQLFLDVTEHSVPEPHPHEFIDLLNRVVNHAICLTAADDDSLRQEGEVLKARRLLFGYCFEQFSKTIAHRDPFLNRGIQALLIYGSALLDQYDTHWRRLAHAHDTRLTSMKNDMKDAIQQIKLLMAQVENSSDGDGGPQLQRGLVSPSGLFEDHGRTPPRLPQEPGIDGYEADKPQWVESAALVGGGNTPTPVRPTVSTLKSCPTKGLSRDSLPFCSGGKVLTLKQLHDTIEEIYTSKSKHDAKCRENGLPRETMEQHMYTYLSQRYGLREIIADWATAIVQAVRRYASEDNDVAVFGKILRNDIDEEFRYVQQQVRETVPEILRTHFKNRKLYADGAELAQLLERKMSGVVEENEWTDVVTYMYNAKDASTIIGIIKGVLEKPALHSQDRKVATQEVFCKLTYKDLIHILLDFQLGSHERLLAPYTAVFRQHDTNRDGIVNAEEFLAIMRTVSHFKNEEERMAMLKRIDPHSTHVITYSETVKFLSKDILRLSWQAC